MPDFDAAFYFDLASPLAYMAAERVLQTMPIATEWQPVLANELPGHESFAAFRCREEQDIFRLELERRADELGLQRMRWPDPFPFDSAFAMRAATYAKSIGRIVAFAQAAFRQAYAGGHPLDVPDNVMIAAAACEMHPSAVLKGAELRSIAEQLSAATSAAAALGVEDVPAVRIGEHVFHGERALEDAATHARRGALPRNERDQARHERDQRRHQPGTDDAATVAAGIAAKVARRSAL
ncbi:MAG TPA: DsbA family protein [Solirubrobacteraceae bacterium]|jgi:2-hydroxychromene-2-carboxylate isomerase|nr:DsbA family protein [Solirubrobacteraceae bacterium]